MATSKEIDGRVQVLGGDVALAVQARTVRDINDGGRLGGLVGRPIANDDVDCIADVRSREVKIDEPVVGDCPERFADVIARGVSR